MDGWFANRKTGEKPLTPSYWQYQFTTSHIHGQLSPLHLNACYFYPQTPDELWPSCQLFYLNIQHQPLVSNQRLKYSLYRTNTSLFGYGCFQASCWACQGKHEHDLTRTFCGGPGHGAQVAATSSDVRRPLCVRLLSPAGGKAHWYWHWGWSRVQIEKKAKVVFLAVRHDYLTLQG